MRSQRTSARRRDETPGASPARLHPHSSLGQRRWKDRVGRELCGGTGGWSLCASVTGMNTGTHTLSPKKLGKRTTRRPGVLRGMRTTWCGAGLRCGAGVARGGAVLKLFDMRRRRVECDSAHGQHGSRVFCRDLRFPPCRAPQRGAARQEPLGSHLQTATHPGAARPGVMTPTNVAPSFYYDPGGDTPLGPGGDTPPGPPHVSVTPSTLLRRRQDRETHRCHASARSQQLAQHASAWAARVRKHRVGGSVLPASSGRERRSTRGQGRPCTDTRGPRRWPRRCGSCRWCLEAQWTPGAGP